MSGTDPPGLYISATSPLEYSQRTNSIAFAYADSDHFEYPTNTLRVFLVEMTLKRPFPRGFNMEYTWCLCRVVAHSKQASDIV